MRIFVKLFSNFAFYHSPSKFSLEVPAGIRILDILKVLRIPEDLPRITLVNGQVADEENTLKEGDTVSVFSPVTGG